MNNRGNRNLAYYIGLGLTLGAGIGVSLGTAFGAAFGAVRMGIVYGPVICASLGLIAGIILFNKKRPDEAV